MTCFNISERGAIADQGSFWVRIKRKVKYVKIQDDEVVADEDIAHVNNNKGERFKKDFDYHVDKVYEDNSKEQKNEYVLGEEHKMISLGNFTTEYLCNQGERITELKSVEIHIMKIQTQEEIEKGTNKRCLVNSRYVSC